MSNKTCLIKGCNKKIWWRSYCSTHGQRLKFNGDPLLTKYEIHGMRNTPEYRTWLDMRERCNNKTNKAYHRYGGRGISVCSEWAKSFNTFYRDMGDKPSKDHQIDRIDNNGNYEPNNCRWATRIEQCNNRNNSKEFTYQGKSMTLPNWARHNNMSYDKLRQRVIRYKWSIDKALTEN